MQDSEGFVINRVPHRPIRLHTVEIRGVDQPAPFQRLDNPANRMLTPKGQLLVPLGVGIVDPPPSLVLMRRLSEPVMQLLKKECFVQTNLARERWQHLEGFFLDQKTAVGLPFHQPRRALSFDVRCIPGHDFPLSTAAST